MRTIHSKIRCPDALITCTKFPDTEKLAPDVVVIFEILSPTSGGTDRIEKVREYAAVPSILRYVIVESTTAGVQVLHRDNDESPWTIHALTKDDVIALPEVGIEIPVAELYDDVAFENAEAGGEDA